MILPSLSLGLKALWQLKVKNGPILLSHGVNSKCNLKCNFCPHWKETKSEMSTEETIKLLKEAKSLGISLYNAWTTEPLLRKDLPKILDFAHHLGMITSAVTNGLLLKKRARELSDLDYLSISVDGSESYTSIRGVELDKVLDGIKEARDRGIATVINCVINEKNLDEIEELILTARRLDAWISFEPIHEYEEVSSDVWGNIGIRNVGKYKKIIKRILKLKKQGLPIINSRTYLTMIKNLTPNFRCQASNVILDVTSDGGIENCRVHRASIGEFKNGLSNAWRSSEASRRRITMECSGCLFYGYAELSLLLSLKQEALQNAVNILKGLKRMKDIS